MKCTYFFVLFGLIITMMGVSCSSNTSPLVKGAGDTVSVAVVKMNDTTSFKKANGEICHIYADATFSYPTSYVDKPTLEKLQRLYAALILDAPDSLSLNDAMRMCVANSLHQYDMTASTPTELTDSVDSDSSVKGYHTTTTVQLHYNSNDLVTFCRVEMVRKDTMVTSITHKFYTIDLKTMTAVGLDKLIRDDAQTQVTKLLRSKLLEQNRVESNDQLNELGYYNIDNLIVNSNFYFDANGVTWSYLPNELAVSAIGEPQVTLGYDALAPYVCEGSVLNRMK